MRSVEDISHKILERAYFTQEHLDKYGNWSDIPREISRRLSFALTDALQFELRKYAHEIAIAYSSNHGIDSRNLLIYQLPDEPIKLAFDPSISMPLKGLSKDQRFDHIHVRRIFRNRVSRNLWLGIKPGIITSQYFIPDIEHFTKMIREHGHLKCWHPLMSILATGRDYSFNMFAFNNFIKLREMAILLLPYVRGERDFKWIVDQNKDKESA